MTFTTLALLGLSAAGIGLQAYGQHKAGQAAEKAGEAAAKASESAAGISDYNAQVAELQAKDAIERGAQEEDRFRTQVRGAIGTQRAGLAANNVDVGFGSAVDVQADAAYLGELDALTIKNNAARESWGYEVQAYDEKQRARIARETGQYQIEAGKTAATTGNINAIGTIATGAGSLLMARYGFGTSRTSAV
jgi:hypothetical protein